MTYLLSISIGPVQPFIEAARRTADLTAGSELLVEIAKAVAGSVKAGGGELIFPADPSKDGPNKILAKVSGDPAAITDQARAAAQSVLETAWGRALQVVGTTHVNTDLAQAQIEKFLEFYAAWVPLGPDYKTAREEVEFLLAGRKALREFGQPRSLSGIPKSPLDPARDRVVLESMPRAKGPLFLKKAEHLDAVSLIKRVLGRSKGGVPSTPELSSVALQWKLGHDNPDGITAISSIAESTNGKLSVGDLLYPGRLKDAVESGELTEDQRTRARNAFNGKEPPDWASYYAILCADGDHMGSLIGKMDSAEKHIEFSRKLSGFAEQAKTIVTDHSGHCVYSGGDDVVALLPTHTALQCAADLASAFKSAVDGSLSVGVAIVHHMDPLRISLERAREAEREAKKARDSLAVALHTRGGEPRIVSENWNTNCSLQTWTDWIAAFRAKEGLSHGFPYELRHLAREAKGVLPLETLKAEAKRILDRKKGGKADGEQQYRPALVAALNELTGTDALEDLVAKLIICRFLAQYPEVK